MLKRSESFISIESLIFKRSAVLITHYYLQESCFSKKKENIRGGKKKNLSSASNQDAVKRNQISPFTSNNQKIGLNI